MGQECGWGRRWITAGQLTNILESMNISYINIFVGSVVRFRLNAFMTPDNLQFLFSLCVNQNFYIFIRCFLLLFFFLFCSILLFYLAFAGAASSAIIKLFTIWTFRWSWNNNILFFFIWFCSSRQAVLINFESIFIGLAVRQNGHIVLYARFGSLLIYRFSVAPMGGLAGWLAG